MDFTDGLVVYAVIWWLVIFTVLPWGNRAIEAEDVAKGQMAGAPQKPRILIKAGITTVIATVVFAIVYALITSGAISFRPG